MGKRHASERKEVSQSDISPQGLRGASKEKSCADEVAAGEPSREQTGMR